MATTPEERFDRIERTLDRILERHETLARTIDVLGDMQRASDERLAQIMDTMTSLANIISSHDQRLDNLEKR
jgi:hypothetical protein